MAKMMAKLSTRRYRAGLEPVGSAGRGHGPLDVEVGRVPAFRRGHRDGPGRAAGHGDLSGLDLVALMVDGVHFADHLVVVAMGIGIDGTKHPLAVVEGSTENATLVTDLLVGLRDRGLDMTRPVLVVIDGSKALSAAVRAVFDHPVIARCQLHKIRNVVSKLPEALGSTVAKKMRAAYRMDNALAAQASWRTSLATSPRPTPGPLARCERAWPRPSPSSAWA